MADSSILGGDASKENPLGLDAVSLKLLSQFLKDTAASTGPKAFVGGSTIVAASGENGTVQGAFTPVTGNATGDIKDAGASGMQVTVSAPAQLGMTWEGKNGMTGAEVSTFLNAELNKYIGDVGGPNSGLAMHKASLQAAIADLVGSIPTGGTIAVTRMVDFLNSLQGHSPAAGEFVFDATATPSTNLFAFALSQLGGTPLVLRGVDKALVAGEGTVRVEGSDAIRLVGDMFAQKMTGGAGADTLVGGGGNDTLTGGSSGDIFGFSQGALGQFVVTDFVRGSDSLAFKIDGVTNVATLNSLVTFTDTGSGTKIAFKNADASITLVGVNVTALTDDMVKFTF